MKPEQCVTSRRPAAGQQDHCGPLIFDCGPTIPRPSTQPNLWLPKDIHLLGDGLIVRMDEGPNVRLLGQVGLFVRSFPRSKLKKVLEITHLDERGCEHSVTLTYSDLNRSSVSCAKRLRKRGISVNDEPVAMDLAMLVLKKVLLQNAPRRRRPNRRGRL